MNTECLTPIRTRNQPEVYPGIAGTQFEQYHLNLYPHTTRRNEKYLQSI